MMVRGLRLRCDCVQVLCVQRGLLPPAALTTWLCGGAAENGTSSSILPKYDELKRRSAATIGRRGVAVAAEAGAGDAPVPRGVVVPLAQAPRTVGSDYMTKVRVVPVLRVVPVGCATSSGTRVWGVQLTSRTRIAGLGRTTHVWCRLSQEEEEQIQFSQRKGKGKKKRLRKKKKQKRSRGDSGAGAKDNGGSQSDGDGDHGSRRTARGTASTSERANNKRRRRQVRHNTLGVVHASLLCVTDLALHALDARVCVRVCDVSVTCRAVSGVRCGSRARGPARRHAAQRGTGCQPSTHNGCFQDCESCRVARPPPCAAFRCQRRGLGWTRRQFGCAPDRTDWSPRVQLLGR